MRASVVMAVRNARATLADQLDSLRTQDCEEPWEVIVVDDGSTDGSWELADEWTRRLPNLRIMRSLRRGRSSARNAGAELAKSDRLLFCDADDVVTSSWVRAMSHALDSLDLVGGALECALLNTPRSLAIRDPIQGDTLPTTLGHLPYASSANLGVRHNVFEAVRGFDESLERGIDADLCWRAQYAGFSIAFTPEAVVHYRFRDTRAEVTRQMYEYALANQALYAKHHRLGRVAAPPLSRYKVALFQILRAVVRVPALASGHRRWRYLGEVARCRGSIVGLVRYRIRPW